MLEVDDILDRAIAGDAAAVAYLLQIHDEALSTHVRRRMPQRLAAIASPEDIVQDVCFEACRLIGNFKPAGANSFIRWLQVVANHRILALLRQQRSRRTLSASADQSTLDALHQLASNRRSPSASAAAHEFALSVERSIARLNQDYRTVLTLRFLDGCSVDDAASRMSKSADAIYLLSTRALKSLRVQLASESRWR